MDATAIPADFELIPPVEAAIDALARAGRTDPATRNALWSVLETKAARFVNAQRRRMWGTLTPQDREELAQQAFLVYADILVKWDGEGSFARRFFYLFPRRLREASGQVVGRLAFMRPLPLEAHLVGRLDEPDPLALLLPPHPGEAEPLCRLVAGGWKVDEAAQVLGWTRRTAYRRWATVRGRLQRGMAA